MYAIIRTGSKQYRVAQDTVIDVELLEGNPGDAVEFKDVLLLNKNDTVTVGAPLVKNCSVTGEIVGSVAGEKLVTLKYKQRKNTERKKGHRQKYTRVKIRSITHGT
ncbi:MAG: 50S ribosomal protein L21 [Chlamydiae bacterium]|nr:50S ribosomal protein L21 [Chlamydiota bacterium]